MSGGRFQGVIGCLLWVIVLVSSCAFLSALVHLVPLIRLVERGGLRPVPPFRSSRRGGGAAAGGCLLACARWACDIAHSVPFMLLACSLRGAGKRGVEASVSSCLLGDGDGVDVRRLVPVPCRAIVCPCRSVRLERMR